MMESGVSLTNFVVLLMIVTKVVQDVRIASIWTKRDRITTVGDGGWECVRNIRATTRDKQREKCIKRWRKIRATKQNS